MTTLASFRSLVALSFLVAPWFSPAIRAQSASGVIEGRVYNAATGTALVNARVTLEGTSRTVITDEAGAYRFAGVPAGDARLAVSYIGMAAQAATVNVPAGGTVQREFELVLVGARPGAAADVVRLDAFRVIADREMSAQA
ncbi:MAG: carboxypeptidase-like regulatory domain-containing protein, partial [Verrucomicrobia bacterium]|nr:carboxypeptidase-like regulatory domain-containing protein [Verrucomicrobiota bacterium]